MASHCAPPEQPRLVSPPPCSPPLLGSPSSLCHALCPAVFLTRHAEKSPSTFRTKRTSQRGSSIANCLCWLTSMHSEYWGREQVACRYLVLGYRQVKSGCDYTIFSLHFSRFVVFNVGDTVLLFQCWPKGKLFCSYWPVYFNGCTCSHRYRYIFKMYAQIWEAHTWLVCWVGLLLFTFNSFTKHFTVYVAVAP